MAGQGNALKTVGGGGGGENMKERNLLIHAEIMGGEKKLVNILRILAS
jgi:hypothetical protein